MFSFVSHPIIGKCIRLPPLQSSAQRTPISTESNHFPRTPICLHISWIHMNLPSWHNSFWGFCRTTTQLLLQSIWKLFFFFLRGAASVQEKSINIMLLSVFCRHGLFLSSLLHYPRQSYRVTIMNPFGGKDPSLLEPPARIRSPPHFSSDL